MKTYTTTEAAKAAGVSRDTVYRWMRAGKIQGARFTEVGDFQIRRWTERDVERIRKFKAENYRKGRGRKPNK